MKILPYPISIAGLFAALTLPLDFLGYATMIGEAWPTIRAFLPLIGSTLAVGFTFWIVMRLAFDIGKCLKERALRNQLQLEGRIGRLRSEYRQSQRAVRGRFPGNSSVADLQMLRDDLRKYKLSSHFKGTLGIQKT